MASSATASSQQPYALQRNSAALFAARTSPPALYDTSVSSVNLDHDDSQLQQQPQKSSTGTSTKNKTIGSYTIGSYLRSQQDKQETAATAVSSPYLPSSMETSSQNSILDGVESNTGAPSTFLSRGDTSWIASSSNKNDNKASRSTNNHNNNSTSSYLSQHNHAKLTASAENLFLSNSTSSSWTQSEPGTNEHDRFSAYVNRFATLDPRMDHRSETPPPGARQLRRKSGGGNGGRVGGDSVVVKSSSNPFDDDEDEGDNNHNHNKFDTSNNPFDDSKDASPQARLRSTQRKSNHNPFDDSDGGGATPPQPSRSGGANSKSNNTNPFDDSDGGDAPPQQPRLSEDKRGNKGNNNNPFNDDHPVVAPRLAPRNSSSSNNNNPFDSDSGDAPQQPRSSEVKRGISKKNSNNNNNPFADDDRDDGIAPPPPPPQPRSPAATRRPSASSSPVSRRLDTALARAAQRSAQSRAGGYKPEEYGRRTPTTTGGSRPTTPHSGTDEWDELRPTESQSDIGVPASSHPRTATTRRHPTPPHWRDLSSSGRTRDLAQRFEQRLGRKGRQPRLTTTTTAGDGAESLSVSGATSATATPVVANSDHATTPARLVQNDETQRFSTAVRPGVRISSPFQNRDTGGGGGGVVSSSTGHRVGRHTVATDGEVRQPRPKSLPPPPRRRRPSTGRMQSRWPPSEGGMIDHDCARDLPAATSEAAQATVTTNAATKPRRLAAWPAEALEHEEGLAGGEASTVGHRSALQRRAHAARSLSPVRGRQAMSNAAETDSSKSISPPAQSHHWWRSVQQRPDAESPDTSQIRDCSSHQNNKTIKPPATNGPTIGISPHSVHSPLSPVSSAAYSRHPELSAVARRRAAFEKDHRTTPTTNTTTKSLNAPAAPGASAKPANHSDTTVKNENPVEPQELSADKFKSRYYEAASRRIVIPSSDPRDSASVVERRRVKDIAGSPHTTPTTTKTISSVVVQPFDDEEDAQPLDPAWRRERSEQGAGSMNTSKTTAVTERSTPSRETMRSADERTDRALGNTHEQGSVMANGTKKNRHEETMDQPRDQPPAPKATVESLLQQLGEVNRDDPHAALAQIDAILKQRALLSTAQPESATSSPSAPKSRTTRDDESSEMQPRAPPQVAETFRPFVRRCESTESASSNETSVSSITNPTYQESTTRKATMGRSEPLGTASGRPRPSTLQGYTKSSNRKLLGSAGSLTANTNPFADSTPTPYQPLTDAARKQTHKLRASSPVSFVPSSVASREKERTVLDLVQSADISRNNPIQSPNMIAPEQRGPTSPSPSTTKQTRIDLPPTTKKAEPSFLEKIGSLISQSTGVQDATSASTASAELDQKIKRWDELSTGFIPPPSTKHDITSPSPSVTVAATAAATTTTPVATVKPGDTAEDPFTTSLSNDGKRDHPWDSEMPVRTGKVSLRDTSMEYGAGLETQYTPRNDQEPFATNAKDPFPPARRIGKDRLSRELRNTKEVLPSMGREGAKSGNSFDAESFKMTDSKRLIPSYQQRNDTEAMSDPFDSAWVNLPMKDFFNPNDNAQASSLDDQLLRKEPLSRKEMDLFQQDEVRLTRSYAARSGMQTFSPCEKPTDSSAEGGSDRSRHRSSTFDDSIGSFPTQSFDGSYDMSRMSNSSKARRGLRGFMKRKQGAATKTQTGEQATHVSTGSKRFTDQRLDGFMERQSKSASSTKEKSQIRKSARSRSPNDRSRARSLDERRIRNPNIARKFSKLLRVYNDDDSARGYV